MTIQRPEKRIISNCGKGEIERRKGGSLKKDETSMKEKMAKKVSEGNAVVLAHPME